VGDLMAPRECGSDGAPQVLERILRRPCRALSSTPRLLAGRGLHGSDRRALCPRSLWHGLGHSTCG
jgi:hypothetical protein